MNNDFWEEVLNKFNEWANALADILRHFAYSVEFYYAKPKTPKEYAEELHGKHRDKQHKLNIVTSIVRDKHLYFHSRKSMKPHDFA